jgi:Ino eighty subunit 1
MSPVETPKNKGGRPRNAAKRTYDGELKPLAQRIVLTKGGRPLSAPENQNAGRLQSMDRSSPALNNTGTRQRMTSHQLAVQQNRRDRVNHVIVRKMQRLDARKKRQRLKQGAFVRAWSRIKDIEDPLLVSDDEYPLKHTAEMVADDTNINGDDDIHPNKRSKFAHRTTTYTRGPIGLAPRRDEELADGVDDFGEEAMSIAAAIRRTKRRLERWELVDARHEFGDDVTDADADADGDEEVWDEEEGDAPAEAGAEQEEESDEDGDGDIDME